jgi:hypothetical protein
MRYQKKTTPKYRIHYMPLDDTTQDGHWNVILAITFQDAIKELKEKHNVDLSYDKFQCLLLDRRNVRKHYPNIRIEYVNPKPKRNKTPPIVCTCQCHKK